MHKDKREVKITFRLNETERDSLNAFAAEHDLTVSQVVRRAIKQYLKENKE